MSRRSYLRKAMMSACVILALTAGSAWAEETEAPVSRVIVAGQGQSQTQASGEQVQLIGPGGQTSQQPEQLTEVQPTQPTELEQVQPTQPEQPEQPTEPEQPAQPEQPTEPEQPAQTTGGRYIDPSKPMVALTYDDGPQTSVGNRIMDIFAAYGGKTTFFLVGDRVASRSAEVRRMAAEGHEIANHTMNHKYLQKQSAGVIQSQVAQCNQVIQSVTGVRPTIMRLPGGGYNNTVLANTGMPMIQWSIDTLDWKTKNASSTVNAVLSKVKDGDIVLMHELYDATAAATEQIVPELVKRGYQLVTVSELAQAKGKSLQAGKLYSSIR